jgi:DNA-binding MarR family transcriptional regulator
MASDQAPKKILKRKGRYLSNQDLERLEAAIKTRGEAVPGELAQELGWARSSLAYNLNRLLKKGWIVRLGGGRSIRYRMATDEEWRAFYQKQANPGNQPQKNKRPQKLSLADRIKKFLAD